MFTSDDSSMQIPTLQSRLVHHRNRPPARLQSYGDFALISCPHFYSITSICSLWTKLIMDSVNLPSLNSLPLSCINYLHVQTLSQLCRGAHGCRLLAKALKSQRLYHGLELIWATSLNESVGTSQVRVSSSLADCPNAICTITVLNIYFFFFFYFSVTSNIK